MTTNPEIASAPEKKNLVGLSREELAAEVAAVGEKPFRAKQLWHWIYHQGESDFAKMTTLAKPLREKLAEVFFQEKNLPMSKAYALKAIRLREKNGRPFWSAPNELLDNPPKSKIKASCRKKSRFSGKNSGKRVRLIWRSSTSVSAKSVLRVRLRVRLGMIL